MTKAKRKQRGADLTDAEVRAILVQSMADADADLDFPTARRSPPRVLSAFTMLPLMVSSRVWVGLSEIRAKGDHRNGPATGEGALARRGIPQRHHRTPSVTTPADVSRFPRK
jgi:hypothetical protein